MRTEAPDWRNLIQEYFHSYLSSNRKKVIVARDFVFIIRTWGLPSY